SLKGSDNKLSDGCQFFIKNFNNYFSSLKNRIASSSSLAFIIIKIDSLKGSDNKLSDGCQFFIKNFN
ncbi:hypothetical protein, partial [Brachyspira hyodysenteriae]